ncbi:PIG-L family deacetylase, partial [Burkholderia cenocepacia]
MPDPTRWLVVSPHLDDAVFSFGQLLAQAPGSIVVTVFAGMPPPVMPAPPWDRRAGFLQPDEAMRARRDEGRRAPALLDAHPVSLDLLDAPYGIPSTSP